MNKRKWIVVKMVITMPLFALGMIVGVAITAIKDGISWGRIDFYQN